MTQQTLSSPSNTSDRRLVGVHKEHVSNVSSTDFPGHYPGEEVQHAWSLPRFKSGLKVSVKRLSQRSIELDLVSVDASIANAIRRTLIAEVPTMCIESVYVNNNTSVVQDEVLAHRLGMVPLNVHPDSFRMQGTDPTDQDTIVFRLDVECSRKPGTPKNARDLDEMYENHLVTAGMLQWEPQGEQATMPQLVRTPPAPTRPKIVLAKLRPGQVISLECHAVKGIGQDHAKFSPVATASYRLHPHIAILKQPPPHLARKFADCFSPGVINVINESIQKAKVKINDDSVRGESMTREVFRHSEFDGCVRLGRVRDHFLFSIESESAYDPETLFPTAIRVIRNRIGVLKRAALALANGELEGEQETVFGVGESGGGSAVELEAMLGVGRAGRETTGASNAKEKDGDIIMES